MSMEVMSIIGQKVILNHLLYPGDYSGVVTNVDIFGRCTVKLDEQGKLVTHVLYYEEEPTEVVSNLWQICYPMKED